MSSECTMTQVALSVWSPHHDDLPDHIAHHLDHCPHCVAVFDARYPPAHIEARALAPARRRPLQPIAVAVALGLLLLPNVIPTPSPTGRTLAQLGESPLTADERLSSPECLPSADLEHPVCEDLEWL